MVITIFRFLDNSRFKWDAACFRLRFADTDDDEIVFSVVLSTDSSLTVLSSYASSSDDEDESDANERFTFFLHAGVFFEDVVDAAPAMPFFDLQLFRCAALPEELAAMSFVDLFFTGLRRASTFPTPPPTIFPERVIIPPLLGCTILVLGLGLVLELGLELVFGFSRSSALIFSAKYLDGNFEKRNLR